MNGAETLLRTLLNNNVEVCFANPGTSEMQFVAALDRHQAMRGVLCLFEGVATGAADEREPVASFAYPGRPGILTPPGTLVHRFVPDAGFDVVEALTELADSVAPGPLAPLP